MVNAPLKNKDVAGKMPVGTTAAKDAATSQDAKRKPAATIRVEDCSASIWARDFVVQGRPKVFFSVTLERSFKDHRTGAWRYTRSFDVDSLGKIVSLCQQAEEAIRGLQQQEVA